MKIVQALEDSNILLKGLLKQLKMKQKNKRGDFQECYQVIQGLQSWSSYFGTSQYFSTGPIHRKRNMLSSMGNSAQELPHDLLNNLNLVSKEIWKDQKNLKFGWTHSLVPSLPSRNQTLAIAVKKHAKRDTKLFSLSSFTTILHFVSNTFFRIVFFQKTCQQEKEC